MSKYKSFPLRLTEEQFRALETFKYKKVFKNISKAISEAVDTLIEKHKDQL